LLSHDMDEATSFGRWQCHQSEQDELPND